MGVLQVKVCCSRRFRCQLAVLLLGFVVSCSGRSAAPDGAGGSGSGGKGGGTVSIPVPGGSQGGASESGASGAPLWAGGFRLRLRTKRRATRGRRLFRLPGGLLRRRADDRVGQQ